MREERIGVYKVSVGIEMILKHTSGLMECFKIPQSRNFRSLLNKESWERSIDD